MFVSYYWKCSNCGFETEAHHGDVFRPPSHCGDEMTTIKMDTARLKARNQKILSNTDILKNLPKGTIVKLLVDTYGGVASKYSVMTKEKLVGYCLTISK